MRTRGLPPSSRVAAPPVVVFGGCGFFGRLLIKELLGELDCPIRAAGRRPQSFEIMQRQFASERLSFVAADLHDRMSVERALDQTRVAVCAAGPFAELPDTLIRACLDRGIHYLDLAEHRGYVARVRAAVAGRRGALPTVCSAWSTACALTGLLARLAAEGFERVESVRGHLAPGNRGGRSAATIAALLSGLGPWGNPREFPFPPPVGPRKGYLAEVVDIDLLPELFGGAEVEFRVGTEFSVLNGALSLLAWGVRRGLVRDARACAGALSLLSSLLGGLGHDWGAVGVEVQGARASRSAMRRVVVTAERQGEALAVMPAALTVPRLLAGTFPPGWAAHDRWLSGTEFAAACARRGYRLKLGEVHEGPHE